MGYEQVAKNDTNLKQKVAKQERQARKEDARARKAAARKSGKMPVGLKILGIFAGVCAVLAVAGVLFVNLVVLNDEEDFSNLTNSYFVSDTSKLVLREEAEYSTDDFLGAVNRYTVLYYDGSETTDLKVFYQFANEESLEVFKAELEEFAQANEDFSGVTFAGRYAIFQYRESYYRTVSVSGFQILMNEASTSSNKVKTLESCEGIPTVCEEGDEACEYERNRCARIYENYGTSSEAASDEMTVESQDVDDAATEMIEVTEEMGTQGLIDDGEEEVEFLVPEQSHTGEPEIVE